MEKVKYYFFAGLLVVIILTICSIHYSTVGRVVGSLNVTIYSLASLNFTVNSIDFGSGSVFLNSSSAEIDTQGGVIGGNWTPVNGGFIIENMGNINLSVFLKSEKNAVEFLGGTNPGYYYLFSNLEQNSCTVNATAMNVWNSVNTSGYGSNLCENMQYLDSNDSLRVDLKLVIPSDAIGGSRTDVLTVTGINI